MMLALIGHGDASSFGLGELCRLRSSPPAHYQSSTGGDTKSFLRHTPTHIHHTNHVDYNGRLKKMPKSPLYHKECATIMGSRRLIPQLQHLKHPSTTTTIPRLPRAIMAISKIT